MSSETSRDGELDHSAVGTGAHGRAPRSRPGRRAAGGSADTIWTRPVRGERGPAGELSREEIAAAATALADFEGMSAVTMRAVGAALGGSAAGLYRYVRGRGELLALMVDATLAELSYPAPDGDWGRQLLEVARAQLALNRAHPWLVAASLEVGITGPNTLRHFDRCLAILDGVQVPGTAKMETLAMLTGVVNLFARPVPEHASDPSLYFAALDPVAHPHLNAVLAEPPGGPTADPEDLFDRVIRSVLRGLLTPDRQ